MKIRNLAIAVALLAVLSAVAYLANRPKPAPSADPRVGKALLDADTASKAAGIEVADQGKKVDLARAPDGSWRVSTYYDLPADFDKISRLVQDLNEAKVDRFVTSSPDRLSHLEFKDSRIALSDPSGKAIWTLTLGKSSDSGNGRFIRFGDEPKAFFSGMHVWLDTDAKGWANAQLVSVKPDDVAKVEIGFDEGAAVVATRTKKDAPWTAAQAPAGKKLLAEKVSSALSTLTSLRFSETTDPKDAAAAEAHKHMRAYRLTTFGGTTLTVSLGRKPEEKRIKPPVPDAKEPLAALAKGTDAKPDTKALTPEFETTPAGPVFVEISSSESKAPINGLMEKRAFQVEEYSFTALPQKADELFEAEKAK
jgi:hypothetical protein